MRSLFIFCSFFLMIRRPPRSTLFPYTRSSDLIARAARSPRDRPPEGDRPWSGIRRWSCRRRHREERSEEHTSELQSRLHLVCRLLLEKKKDNRRATASAYDADALTHLRQRLLP